MSECHKRRKEKERKVIVSGCSKHTKKYTRARQFDVPMASRSICICVSIFKA